MLELTPLRPYNQYACALNGIEQNMHDRRMKVYDYLNENEDLLMIPHFPLLGEGDFAATMGPLHGSVANSDYIPDTIISPFPRFAYNAFIHLFSLLEPLLATSEPVVVRRSIFKFPHSKT